MSVASPEARPRVAVFDIELPTGVAFLRSLGRAGIPRIVYTHDSRAVGRRSRYVDDLRPCPSVHDTDDFVAWLATEVRRGEFDLVAPTSDYLSFNVAEVMELLPGFTGVGTAPDAIRRCLFKDRFTAEFPALGFPVPPSATPTSLDEALEAADRIGYPVVLKPRSHAGLGTERGTTVSSPDELRTKFLPYPLRPGQTAVSRRDTELAWPLVQQYHEHGSVDVVSISGCLDPDGTLLAVSHCRKLGQLFRGLGVGTVFEYLPGAPFTDQGIDAVRAMLGAGIFELEVLVDPASGEYWAIDLNPRAFGQMALDIARGNDLPVLWYESVTGLTVSPSPARRRPPRYWYQAVNAHVAGIVGVVRGPQRGAQARRALERWTSPHVGAVFDRRDPIPGLLYGAALLKHPRFMLRMILAGTDLPAERDQSAGAQRSR